MSAPRVLVVGAGPAGLAAAVAAGESGADVTLVDGGAAPGGQYWRHRDGVPAQHHSWRRYESLVARLRAAGVRQLAEHQVATIDRMSTGGFRLTVVHPVEPRSRRTVRTLETQRLILAPGAYDRQLPFPGWDLPGVLAAGGVQALLKQHGVLAGRRVVVAGTGPFLASVAAQLLAAGAEVPAVIEANSPVGFWRRPRAVLGAASKLAEAGGYASRLALSRTPYLTRHAVAEVCGADTVTGVRVVRLDATGAIRPGSSRELACDVLAVGWGFVAQLELALQLGCTVGFGPDGGLAVRVDDEQRCSVEGVWAAGEATGIGGAELAVAEGMIAGRSAAGADPERRDQRARRRLRRFASALHAVHPLPRFLLDDLPDATLVCRCEEVGAGRLRHAVDDLGATDARTVKLLTRAGMGWCQGRVCGPATALLCARHLGRAPDVGELAALAARPFSVPLSTRELIEQKEDRPFG